MEDIRRIVSSQPWLWRGWIADGVVNALAAEPGVGKTRFALDLARRLWHGEPWPDGQANTLPPGTRTLWVLGDRNWAEVLHTLETFGLPDDALALGAPPDDPTGVLDLDEPEDLAALAGHVRAARPALVVIDTIGMVTARNLGQTSEARAFFAPLMDLAAANHVALLGLTHLSLHKEALGRRIVEKARVVVKMTHPDPDGQPDRRRLWVDKAAGVSPPALGMTLAEEGNTYDFDPPGAPRPAEPAVSGGRPQAKLETCLAWLADRLSDQPVPALEVRRAAEAAGISNGRLYAARSMLGVESFYENDQRFWRLPCRLE
jgi:hypothetical protein